MAVLIIPVTIIGHETLLCFRKKVAPIVWGAISTNVRMYQGFLAAGLARISNGRA
jgi:hypothetical protein